MANAIAQSYIEHTYNLRFRAASGLSAFMERQLEELKAKMERSSAALASFEKDLTVINPEEKTSILSSRLLQLNTELTNAQADRVRKQAAHNSVGGGSLEAAQASTTRRTTQAAGGTESTKRGRNSRLSKRNMDLAIPNTRRWPPK